MSRSALEELFPPAEPAPGARWLDPGLRNRALGCLMGQVAGDSLGGLVEFQSEEQIRRSYPQGVREMARDGHWGTLPGQPTDDSELALLLARSIVREGEFKLSKVAEAYALWFGSQPFDCGMTIGTALRPALEALTADEDPAAAAIAAATLSSRANGALMRISPLALYCYAAPPKVTAGLAREEASLTHPDPVCRDASAVFTVLLTRALLGTSVEEFYDYTVNWARRENIHDDVQKALITGPMAPPRDYLSRQGYVLIALKNAVYQLFSAATLEAGVVDTIMRGGDTDTNAAVCGALLGAVHGEEAIPRQWSESVLSCRPEAGHPGVRHPRPQPLWPVDLPMLADRLLLAGGHLAHLPFH